MGLSRALHQPAISSEERAFGACVVRWGARSRRSLPWRETRDPWAILVSEVMLQQTQVARVIGPYARFTARFPAPADCAAAGQAEVVQLWRGLGYNRRAVSLHRAARQVVEHHGGRLPSALAPLRALPGVGDYTARAVMVFAFELPVAVVETNVARVLARAVAGRPLTVAEAQQVADRLVPPRRAWAFNQAMIDVGALHCRSVPDCAGCPLRRRCAWRQDPTARPDPALGSAGRSRRQSAFAGSDRQGCGRLVDALRRGPVPRILLADAAGWPDDPPRAEAAAARLVADGLAVRGPGGVLQLAGPDASVRRAERG